jgi:hypothetical protein
MNERELRDLFVKTLLGAFLPALVILLVMRRRVRQ